MASRDYTRHTVSSTAPAIARVGDEYYNPTTNTLYKSVAYNGTTVQWEAIPMSPNGADYTISGNLTTIGTETVGNLITANGVFWSNGVSALSNYGNTQVLANLAAAGNPVTIGSNLIANSITVAATSINAVSSVNITSTGYVQSPNPYTGPISIFRQGTGLLANISANISSGTSTRGVVVEATGRFLYASNFTSATVSMYSINQATGNLTPLSTPTIATGTGVQNVTCDPLGRFVYTMNYTAGTISQFIINQTTGILSSIGADVTTGFGTFSGNYIGCDPLGRFLYASNAGGLGKIAIYTINQSTGALTAISGSPISVATNPLGFAFDPTSRFFYVNAGSAGAYYVQQYSINQTTGNLIIGSASATWAGAGLVQNMTCDPTGRFLFASQVTSASSIQVFAISQANGAVVFASNITGGASIRGLTCDPTGYFLYSANSGDNTVSQFAINQTTGALTNLGNVAISTGGSPVFVAMDPIGRFLYTANQTGGSISQFVVNNFSAGTGTFAGNLTIGGNLSVLGNVTNITEATVTNGSSGSAITLSLANGTFQTITWTANCTVTMPAVTSGKSFTLLANTGTPGPYTTTTFTGVRWPGGTAPTITATANKADVFSFISDGAYWYGFYNQNY